MDAFVGNNSDVSPDIALNNLYPALIQCFAVILVGYLTGRLGVVSQEQTEGLSTFVGVFSLPALIFMSLATLDLSSVSWYFLLSILISKAIVFGIVLLITLLVTKPVHPGKAGLYAIFCTQSNDFALGYPILVSIYGKTHPEYVSYLYLLVPVSLVMLNPIAFVMMELMKRKSDEGSSLKLLGSIALNVATNPVVLMTALGVAGNFILSHSVPTVLANILNVFGSAFTATALFLLGLRMVGKIQNLQGNAIILPILFIITKLLVLPVVIREVTSLLLYSENSTESTELSNYGFLYGTFPSAPGVFVYATHYNLEVDLIASSMVVCTFVSAPLMFISAKMITMSSMTPAEFNSALYDFEFDLSIIGAFACLWLVGVFIVHKKYLKLPQKMTLCLIISQLIGCIGSILGHIHLPHIPFVMYTLVTFSDLSCSLWTTFLSVSLVLLASNKLPLLSKLVPLFTSLAWGIPLLILAVLMFSLKPSQFSSLHWNERFVYGSAEAAITILILLATFLIGIGSMIMQQRHRRRHKQYLSYVRETSSVNSESHNSQRESQIITGFGDAGTSEIINSSESLLDDQSSYNEAQITHHLFLIFFLLTSVFISLALCVWRVIMEDITGVYVELTFLSVTLKRGLSIMAVFIFFGDTIACLEPLYKRVMRAWSGGDPVQLPPLDELPFETQHVCELFNQHHIELCKSQIVKKARVRLWQYKSCFTGSSLVNWLIGQGLVSDRTEGFSYATHLLTGRVIQHVTNTQLFVDDSSLFLFPSSD